MVVKSVSWIISITHPLTRYDSRFVLHMNIGCNAVKSFNEDTLESVN